MLHYAQKTLAPLAPLRRQLDELARLVARLSDAQYTLCPVGEFACSVGAQVRHCLDHVAAFTRAMSSGMLNYDERRRGTDVETDRAAAQAALRELDGALVRWMGVGADRRVRLYALLSDDGQTIEIGSNVGREVLFVQSHTTHHNAIIAAMVRTMGLPLDDNFGVAPATANYRKALACVR